MIRFANCSGPILLVVLFFAFSFHVKSQENCINILEEAEALFEQGIIEEIPGMLEDCIKRGLSPEDRMRAQKLVILSYLFDKNIEEAEKVMLAFLRAHPEYEPHPTDPAEFVQLLSNFEVKPVFSMGTRFGSNFASPVISQAYVPYNISDYIPGFSSFHPGLQFGAGINIYLTNRLEIGLEAEYMKSNIRYSNTQYGFSKLKIEESHERIQFPVSLKYVFPYGIWSPYIKAGASYGIVLDSRAGFERVYTVPASTLHEPVLSRNVNIDNMRNSESWMGFFGTGVRYKIPRGFFFLDISYCFGLSNMVNPKDRWSQETVFDYYHVDGDFRMDYLSLSFGFRLIIYNPRKK